MNRKTYRSFLPLAGLLLASSTVTFLTACGSSNSTTQTPPPVESIAATSGSGQSATVSTAFAAPLVATVTTGGSPTSGVVVTFAAPASGASGTFADSGTNTTTATTNASGVATSPVFTANATAGGPYVVAATVTGVATAANFSLTNTAAPVETIAVTSGSGQSAIVSTAFGALLVATVTTGGVPNSGVVVTFTAPASGASGTFANGMATDTATTDANGVATSTVFTANGTVGGPYTVAATAPGVATPANFSLTNTTVVAVETIVATSGSGQSATVSTAFAAPLIATVTTGGVPQSGLLVTFTAPTVGAGGTFADSGNNTTTATTNASGVATSAVFTANATAGPYTVTASVPGAATPANFSLTNTSAAVEIVVATSGSGQIATISTAFAARLVATVTTGGMPDSGVAVTFTAPASGASGTFANTSSSSSTVTTNGAGVATSAVFTANATQGGPYTVTATAPGVATAADFTLTNAVSGETIVATSGSGQAATVSTAFAAPLVATVTTGGVPDSGVVVTFTAPASGASGTFADSGMKTTTATTNASGVATSAVFTANATAGGPYTVTASAPGVATPANFSLTNTSVPTTNYAFYLSGLEAANNGPNFYALAGSVTIDANGNVVTGKQDYNDAIGFTSPQPAGDSITGGTLTVDSTTGQGKLTLITSNNNLGVSGTETLGVQFVNTNHALIVQFDGTATSSGSMDVQTLPSTLSGGYSFTLSGVDTGYLSIVIGGVFSINGTTLQNGFFDVNDANSGVTLHKPFSGTLTVPDSFGRGTITSAALQITLNYYVVGPEAIRIIDVDALDSGIGSAFGQGAGTFSSTSLGSSVFGVQTNSEGGPFATAGMFTTTPGSGSFQGVADVDEFGVAQNDPTLSGTYAIASNGYGSLTVTDTGLEDVIALGVYMTDPTLNLNDPNNTASGLGGALVADMDSGLGGAGILIPQTDTSTASFANTYAFGAQDANGLGDSSPSEFDFVGLGSVSGGVLSGTGLVSDPFVAFSPTTTDSGATFSGTADADLANPGRYTMVTTPLAITAGGTPPLDFDVVVYQASGEQLLWINVDEFSQFVGSLQQQGSLTGLPAVRRAAAKTKPKP
jgi:hypothetical protein